MQACGKAAKIFIKVESDFKYALLLKLTTQDISFSSSYGLLVGNFKSLLSVLKTVLDNSKLILGIKRYNHFRIWYV